MVLVGLLVLFCLSVRRAGFYRFGEEWGYVTTLGVCLLLSSFLVLKMGQILLEFSGTVLFSVGGICTGARSLRFMRPTGGGIQVFREEAVYIRGGQCETV